MRHRIRQTRIVAREFENRFDLGSHFVAEIDEPAACKWRCIAVGGRGIWQCLHCVPVPETLEKAIVLAQSLTGVLTGALERPASFPEQHFAGGEKQQAVPAERSARGALEQVGKVLGMRAGQRQQVRHVVQPLEQIGGLHCRGAG